MSGPQWPRDQYSPLLLPSFKGAKPYHLSLCQGVKLIGATAHFVTADLDEGPIIEQDIARVDHSMTPEELTAIGRDVECVTLARAVKWHAEHQVLLNGKRRWCLSKRSINFTKQTTAQQSIPLPSQQKGQIFICPFLFQKK